MTAAGTITKLAPRTGLYAAGTYFQFALLGEGGKRFAFPTREAAEAAAAEADGFGFFTTPVTEVRKMETR